MTRRHLALAMLLILTGCARHRLPPPQAHAHYVLGDPYQQAGVWWYPQDRSQYEATGLATIQPARTGLTTDGERADGTALAGAHHTLQLPCIVRVTNLQNGLQVLLRVNDRGPERPGRLIGLSAHAAALLQAQDGAQVRVELEPDMTQALTDQLGGGPRLDIAAAPRADVAAQSLPPPPGLAASARGQSAPGATARSQTAASALQTVPDRLPDAVAQGPAQPGLIYLEADEFSLASYASRQAAMLAGIGATVLRLPDGRTTRYQVRAGPFTTVAQADAALDQARRAGVIDSQLVVE